MGDYVVGPFPGYTAVVRDVDAFWSLGLAAAQLNLFDGNDATFVYAYLGDGGITSELYSWRGRQVIPEGETFTVHTDSALDVRVSGYLLTSP